jgi:hypothetical protein
MTTPALAGGAREIKKKPKMMVWGGVAAPYHHFRNPFREVLTYLVIFSSDRLKMPYKSNF